MLYIENFVSRGFPLEGAESQWTGAGAEADLVYPWVGVEANRPVGANFELTEELAEGGHFCSVGVGEGVHFQTVDGALGTRSVIVHVVAGVRRLYEEGCWRGVARPCWVMAEVLHSSLGLP